MLIAGSCHCGAIRFEAEVPAEVESENCNCSICSKSGYLHLIVPASKFRLLQGQEALQSYHFNTGIAEHTFCKICGIKPFYKPRSNPDGIDINVNCIDSESPIIRVVDFDGRNWEQHAERLAHKSRD